MTEAQQQAWHQVIQLTQSIEQASHKADWESLLELWTQRDQQLQQFFAEPVAELDLPLVRRDCQMLQESCLRLQQQAQEQKSELLPQLNQLQRGLKAQQAYQQHT